MAAARPQLAELIQSLKVFRGVPVADWFVARTGYTGEDGLEIMLPDADAGSLLARAAGRWRRPTGLGARHPASGSRHESVRPRYGRNHQPAGRRAWLDHDSESQPAVILSAAPRWKPNAPPARP